MSGRKTRSDAQVYLEQVEKIDSIIRNKLIEQRQWKDIALGITANMGGDKVQSSGSQSKMADAIAKCVDMESEINRLIDMLIDAKQEVIRTIEELDSPYDYKLLHDRYIKYIDLKEIAVLYGKDYTTITTAHGRALKRVQAILDKR